MDRNWIDFNNLPEALFKLFGELAQIKALLMEAQSTEGNDKLFSIDETSKFLHIQKQTIYSYVSLKASRFLDNSKIDKIRF